MKNKKKTSKAATIKAIKDALAENPKQSLNYKQIAHRVGLSKARQREYLFDLLNKLALQGEIKDVGRGKFQAMHFDRFLEGRVSMTARGAAFIIPDDGSEDVYIDPMDLNTAMDRDRVKICLFASRRKDRLQGEVVEVLKRDRENFVGVIQRKSGFAFLLTDDPKVFHDIYIPNDKLNGAVHGQKVIGRITDWSGDFRNPFGEVVKILGRPGEHDTEMHAIIAEYGFETEFPEAVEAAAAAIPDKVSKEDLKDRRDFRKITTFTIDPEDAKDFDDAISIQKLEHGNWEIGVHIADVSHYVKEGGKIDAEAYDRATSVYLVDRTIPMLPEKLSNGVCSLRPKKEKLCFSAVFEMNEQAKVVNQWFGKTAIYSDKRFTYEEAQQGIETGKGIFADELQTLNKLAIKLKNKRFEQGAISFETEEVKFRLDEKGRPIDVYKKIRKDAHKLVEEFMLLANRSVAGHIFKKKSKTTGLSKTFVYRVHEPPPQEKLQDFNTFVSRFGHRIDMKSQRAIANSFNQLLDKVEGRPEQNILQQLAIRTMSKAYYTTTKAHHYGLAFDFYTHFTSPIRRYPDLMVHRLLEHYLSKGRSKDAETYEPKCRHSSDMESKAAEAERASIKYKQVEYLSHMLGTIHTGIISGVTEWGIYVELLENKCEGMIRLSELGTEYFDYDEKNHWVIGRKSGKKYQLGAEINVKVTRTDMQKRTIDFQLVKDKK